MAVTCTPEALTEAMACYRCMDSGTKIDALLVLLQQMAGTTYTSDELLALGAQYRGMEEGRLWEVIVALLCIIAQNTET